MLLSLENVILPMTLLLLYIYRCILSQWGLYCHYESFLSVLNRLCARIEPKGRASRPKAQGLLLLAVEAIELQVAVFLLPRGVEEVQGDALEEDLGLWQVQALNELILGYLNVGNNSS